MDQLRNDRRPARRPTNLRSTDGVTDARAHVVALVCDDVRVAVADLLAHARRGGDPLPRIERLGDLVDDLAVLAGCEADGVDDERRPGESPFALAYDDLPAAGRRRLRVAPEPA